MDISNIYERRLIYLSGDKTRIDIFRYSTMENHILWMLHWMRTSALLN